MSWAALAVLAFLAGLPVAQSPQVSIRAALNADTVTVGARFVYRVSVRTPSGARARFPAVLDTVGPVTSVAPAALRAFGDTLWTAEYELAAWEPGVQAVAPVIVTVGLPDGSVTAMPAPRGAVAVRSVLPPGPGPFEPRGPKDVWGPSRAWWEIGLAILVPIALALGIAFLLRRWWQRRKRQVPTVVSDPRGIALAALAALEREGVAWLLEGDTEAFHTQLAQILRYGLQALNLSWGTDLTTSEIADRLNEAGVSIRHVRELRDILDETDLVKFARARPTLEDALELTQRARQWVSEFELPVPEVEIVGAAAEAPPESAEGVP